MFKKLCVKAFQSINLAVGATSLAAIAVGALAVFSSGGLFYLEEAGVKTIEEKRIQQTLNFGVGSISLGFSGFLSATVAAACAATIVSDAYLDDEEEPLASGNVNSVVFKSSESLTHDNTESLYLYQIMRINGCSQLGNRLIIGRIEDEALRKVVIYDFLNFYKDELMELFDCDFDEDRLIGKAFSSSSPKPLNAVREFIDFHRPQLEFKNSEGFFSFKLETCAGCRNFHGAEKIVCGIHPYGWDESCACPDWQSNHKKRVYFPFEREETIEELDQSIEKNQAVLTKYDDGTLTLCDLYTRRRFNFSWAGILLDDSDKLLELGEHAQLLSYIQYFSVRAVIEFDYSSKVDEFAKQLKGIANIEISDTGIVITVKHYLMRNNERQYHFQLNGISLHPYESIVPQQLKYNYNLVTFVEWLKANKTRVVR